jgi:putative hemolysin
VLEELVGEISDEHRRDEDQRIVRRDDTSWLVDGTVGIYDFLKSLPEPWSAKAPPEGITTVSGLVLTQLGRVPKVGETVRWDELQVEVVDMDGPRIDRLLIELATAAPPAPPQG